MTDQSISAAQSPLLSIAPTLPEVGSDIEGSALMFNPEPYLALIENSDWTDAQKLEFIETLWVILVGFVDMGFHIHPIQEARCHTQTLEVDSQRVIGSKEISESTNFKPLSARKGSPRKGDQVHVTSK